MKSRPKFNPAPAPDGFFRGRGRLRKTASVGHLLISLGKGHVPTLALVGILIGSCTSAPPAQPATFCSVARSSNCDEPSSCDTMIAASCGELADVLSASTLTAAQHCLESGVCGTANCLSQAQKSATRSKAHRDLATSFCSSCAPDVEECGTRFYGKKSGLPGALVLPYSENLVQSVNAACTADSERCRASFATCATETIARALRATFDPALADCVVRAFRYDESVAGPGGGPQISTCNPTNCSGCCRDDTCEEGTSESGCGKDGAACETCSGAQRCLSGTCKEPCGPSNCIGCCDGDTCMSGSATDKCGGAGGACTSCTTLGASFVCSNQTCIDGSCRETCIDGCCSAAGCQPGSGNGACGAGGEACIDCGYGRACGSAKACAIDPKARWDFYVSFAVLPDKDKSGASWDITNGAPDPYLVAYSSLSGMSHTGQTKVQTDTTMPVWAEVPLKAVTAAELMNNLSFEIWDSDIDFDDLIGGCTLPITAAVFDGALQSHTCPPTASNVPVELFYRIRRP